LKIAYCRTRLRKHFFCEFLAPWNSVEITNETLEQSSATLKSLVNRSNLYSFLS